MVENGRLFSNQVCKIKHVQKQDSFHLTIAQFPWSRENITRETGIFETDLDGGICFLIF